jgi:hypothetical protein
MRPVPFTFCIQAGQQFAQVMMTCWKAGGQAGQTIQTQTLLPLVSQEARVAHCALASRRLYHCGLMLDRYGCATMFHSSDQCNCQDLSLISAQPKKIRKSSLSEFYPEFNSELQ